MDNNPKQTTKAEYDTAGDLNSSVKPLPGTAKTMMPQDIIPIHWFGNRKAYEKSAVRVVTIGLNPSDKEFREDDNMPFSTKLRFPLYQMGKPETLELALDDYFKANPYNKWFKNFECVLNGMGASYYDRKEYPYRALHTDICSPWATVPTWSKLSSKEQDALYAEGHKQWLSLIAELKPDVMIASVAKRYPDELGVIDTQKEFCKFDLTKDGKKRRRPETVWKYEFNGIPFINGRTRNNPFGSLSDEYKQCVGEQIKQKLLRRGAV